MFSKYVVGTTAPTLSCLKICYNIKCVQNTRGFVNNGQTKSCEAYCVHELNPFGTPLPRGSFEVRSLLATCHCFERFERKRTPPVEHMARIHIRGRKKKPALRAVNSFPNKRSWFFFWLLDRTRSVIRRLAAKHMFSGGEITYFDAVRFVVAMVLNQKKKMEQKTTKLEFYTIYFINPIDA